MLRRQLKIAWLPSVAFLVWVSVAIYHHGTAEGSAADGRIDGDRYFLSMGHGPYQETSRERYYAILRNERIVEVSLGAACLFGCYAAYRIAKAGLPLRRQDAIRYPATLRPRV